MKKYFRYPLIIIGAAVMGFAVKCIYNPAGLVTGGFAGMAIIAARVWNIPLWVTNTVLNIPLFVVTWILMGRRVVLRSLLATAVYSASMGIFPEITVFSEDIFLSGATGGLLMGVGIGLVLAVDATSGGVDMLALLINNFARKLKIQWVMFAVDAAVILAGAAVFGPVSAVYAIMSAFLVSFISGKIIDGPVFSRAAVIISGERDRIARRIIKEIGRGVTGIHSRGMYSGKWGLMLFCIASRSEMTRIREIVYDTDKNAFMTVCNVSEVFGEGFIKK